MAEILRRLCAAIRRTPFCPARAGPARGPQDFVQKSGIYDAQDYCGEDACFIGVLDIIPCK
jgi:hypothetical protein